jgi:hypothetical protein
VVSWQHAGGTIGNTHFLGIPFNANAKEDAGADRLLFSRARAQADIAFWGDPRCWPWAAGAPERSSRGGGARRVVTQHAGAARAACLVGRAIEREWARAPASDPRPRRRWWIVPATLFLGRSRRRGLGRLHCGRCIGLVRLWADSQFAPRSP